MTTTPLPKRTTLHPSAFFTILTKHINYRIELNGEDQHRIDELLRLKDFMAGQLVNRVPGSWQEVAIGPDHNPFATPVEVAAAGGNQTRAGQGVGR